MALTALSEEGLTFDGAVNNIVRLHKSDSVQVGKETVSSMASQGVEKQHS